MWQTTTKATRAAILGLMLMTACGGGGDPGSVTPPPAPVATVTLDGGSTPLVPQQSAQLTATLQDAAGATLSGRATTWSAAPSTVASVDATGLVTALGVGTATITATSEGKRATVSITVRDGGMVGAAGGTVIAAGGKVQITFPAGALPTLTPITATPLPPPITPAPVAPGTAYEFAPSGVTFASPATISMQYDPAALPAGVDPSLLRLYRITPTGWIETTGSRVDVATRTVIGTTAHFSPYAACAFPCAQDAPSLRLRFDEAGVLVRSGATTTTTMTLEVNRYAGGAIPVTFEGVPSGMTISHNFPGRALYFDANIRFNITLTIVTSPTVARGTYPITARARASGLEDLTDVSSFFVEPIGFTMTASPALASVAPGASVTATLTMVRNGLTAPVSFSAIGLPAGVTASFTPASATGNSASVTLTAAANAVPGNYNGVVIRGAAAGATNVDVAFPLTVTSGPGFSLAGTPAFVSLTPNASASTGVRVSRTGGFTGVVNYALSGVPAGVSAAVMPTANADSVRIAFVATSQAPLGTHPVTVTGTSGSITQTTTIAATIGAAGTSAVQVDYSACAASVLWVAYQDGNGSFTRLNGSGGVYAFQLTSVRGAVAVTQNRRSGTRTTVSYGAPNELSHVATCEEAVGTKQVNFSSTGLIANDYAVTSLGGGEVTISFPAVTGSMLGVGEGPRDMLSMLVNDVTGLTKRGILRRDQNIANNATAAVLDFNAADSFAPVTGSMSVTGLDGQSSIMFMGYLTGPSCRDYGPLGRLSGSATSVMAGVPTSVQRAGDLHELAVQSPVNPSAASRRVAVTAFRTMGSRTVTLGAMMPAPAVSTLAGPYKRLQANFTLPNDYGEARFDYTVGNTTVRLVGTVGYFGSRTMSLSMPDLSSVAGFNTAWIPTSASSGTTSLFGTSLVGSSCVDGASFRTATIQGTF